MIPARWNTSVKEGHIHTLICWVKEPIFTFTLHPDGITCARVGANKYFSEPELADTVYNVSRCDEVDICCLFGSCIASQEERRAGKAHLSVGHSAASEHNTLPHIVRNDHLAA